MKKIKYLLFLIIALYVVIPTCTLALEGNDDNVEEKENTNEVKKEDNNVETSNTLDFSYQTHIQNIGWQGFKRNGDISGTTGRSLRLEAIKMIVNGYNNPISYSTYIENAGWQNSVGSGSVSGTTGQSKRIEAFKISLSDELAAQYDIYYRVHVSYMGWLGWAKNGETCGAVGYGYNLEAIQVVVVAKGSTAPGNTNDHYREEGLKVSYSSHISYVGWQNYVSNKQISGTTGQSKRVEAVRIRINKGTNDSKIMYSTYVHNSGWQNEVSNGSISGTTGQSKTIEGIKIRLTDDLAAQYDIYYRVHVSYIGWLGWAKNGEAAGAVGYGNNIEALQITIVPKNGNAPGNVNDHYREVELKVSYSSHMSYIGWLKYVSDASVSGTTGQNKSIEGIRLIINKPTTNNYIRYSTYIHNRGWQNEVRNGSLSGTTGQNKKIEAIKINLSDSLLQDYDIYYRVHVSYVGWLDWTKNGEPAGYIGYGQSIEAYQVLVLPKGNPAPGNTTHPFYQQDVISYQTHISYVGWQDMRSNGEVSGTTGQSKRLEAIKIKVDSSTAGNVEYSAHVQNIGWMNFVSNGALGGTEGQGLRLEAIKIRLTGELANKYDIYYRVHAQNYGWLDWAKNGDPAGTRGASLRLEGIQIKLIKKGDPAPGPTAVPYREGRWEVRDGHTYYYDLNNKMADDFAVIDGSKYFFNSLGHLIAINAKKVIDVATYQHNINWTVVKNSGVDEAIIRAGGSYWGTSHSDVESYSDDKFDQNVQGARDVGMPISLYYFSAAKNNSEAEKEAQFLINKANYIKNTYGVTAKYLVYDVEYASDSYGNIGRHNNISRDTRTNLIRAFVNKVRAAGYTPMLYANKQICENAATGINISALLDVPLWYARYNHFPGDAGHTITGWQYTSKEIIPGIDTYTDSSVFGDFV